MKGFVDISGHGLKGLNDILAALTEISTNLSNHYDTAKWMWTSADFAEFILLELQKVYPQSLQYINYG
jgi:hypothetical protein